MEAKQQQEQSMPMEEKQYGKPSMRTGTRRQPVT
jgi:hypothetical protein